MDDSVLDECPESELGDFESSIECDLLSDYSDESYNDDDDDTFSEEEED